MRAALLAAIALGGSLNVACATNMQPPAPHATPGGIRFAVTYPEARSVALAGSFNEWSTSSHPLARDRSSGMWTLVIRLPPGEHHFMYVVDGTQWVSPPIAEEYADDGFGAKNGVVVVGP